VAQPLVLAVSSGLVGSLASFSHHPDHRTSSGALVATRLSLGLVGRLQELLERASVKNAQTDCTWAAVELHSLLAGLASAPWLELVHEHFLQLRMHLSSRAMSWDPDANRLHARLRPLADEISAWGGLKPTLHFAPDFILEQLILSLAGGQAVHRVQEPLALSQLLGGLLIRRHLSSGNARTKEVLSALTAGDSISTSGRTSASTEEWSTLRTHNLFLVLETVQLLWKLVNIADPNCQSFPESVAMLVAHEGSMGHGGIEGNGTAARRSLVQAVAEMIVLEWTTGGDAEGPATLEAAALGLERSGTIEVLAPAMQGQVRERALMAIREHLLEALGAVFSEEGASTTAGLNFMLSPMTLTRLRPKWQPEIAVPAVASLVLESGFACGWALNLCGAAASVTNMANHGAHRSILEGMLSSFIEARSGSAQVGAEWVSVCRLLGAQFHGLSTLSSQNTDLKDGALARAGGFLMTVGDHLSQGAGADLCQDLEVLKSSSERAAQEMERETSAEQNILWPMTFPALAEKFLLPALGLLHRRCSREGVDDSEDADARGAIWVLTSMWRLHSGGGVLVPGGLDVAEIAAEVWGEAQRRADIADAEVLVRGREELAVDGRCGPPAGASADIAREAECWRKEAEDLSDICRLRPPLSGSEVPAGCSGLPSLSVVCPSISSQDAPSYAELCQEMLTFATTVARPERILRLIGQLTGEARPTTAETASELQNLSSSALSFVHRLQTRFPLHADLVAPISLAVNGLVHGLYLANRRIWQSRDVEWESESTRLCTKLRAPTMYASSPRDVLGQDINEEHPEIACWWLRWLALSRKQRPHMLSSPPAEAALDIIRALSKQHAEEEDKREREELAKAAPFRLAKSANLSALEQDGDSEGPELFPGENEEEIATMLGIKSDKDGMDDDADVSEGVGSSLYDLWGPASSGKDRRGASNAAQQPDVLGHLQDAQIADLCDLSLDAFSGDAASSTEIAALVAARKEALDASLELFVRQSVARPATGAVNAKAVLLPADVATQLLPLVALRLRRTIRELQPGMPLTSTEEIGTKRSALDAKKSVLHGEAACAFYSESSPGSIVVADTGALADV